MPPAPNQPEDAVNEELVAYLDGELSPEDRARVEHRLAKDGAYQRRLRELQRTWDLLDSLPRSQPDPVFTRSTVEMVALAASVDVEQQRAGGQRRRNYVLLGGVLGSVLAFVVGVGTVQAILSAPDRQLILDLPVIENLSVFRHVSSLSFLEQLRSSSVFMESAREIDEAPAPPSPGSAEQIRSLPPADRDRLRQSKEQFDRLSQQEQDRIRQLYRQLAEHNAAGELWYVAVRFDQLLRKVSAAERAELLSLSESELVQRVVVQESKPRTPAFRPTSDDMQAFRVWFDDFTTRHEAEFLALLPDDARAKLIRIPDPLGRRRAVQFSVMRTRESADRKPLPVPSREEFSRLAKSLTLATQEELQRTPEDRRLDVLQGWLRESFASRFRGPQVDPAELRRFLSNLPNEKRTELERLSPEVLQTELEKLYYLRNPPPDRPRDPFPPSRRQAELVLSIIATVTSRNQ